MLTENIELFMGLHDIPLEALIEARITLETATAELAALRAGDEDLKKIEKTLSVSSNDKEKIDLLVESSFNFHLALSTAANNPIITHFIVSVKNLLHKCISQNLLLREKPAESLWEHEQIYRAIREKDPAKAKKLMLNHLENYRRRISSLNKDLSFNSD
jgi:DNA-binding FadR family transcriptional regulator